MRKYFILLLPLLVFTSCNKVSSSEFSSEPKASVTSEVSESSTSEQEESSVSDVPASSEISTEQPISTEPEKELSVSLYKNPVIPTNFPDPSVVRHDGYFYVYATGARAAKSADLVNWELLGDMLETRPTWGAFLAGVWAPEVKKIGDQYVMYYSLSVWDDTNPGIGIATSPHPAGPWTDHGKFFTSLEIGVNNSIDAVAHVDDDGRVYLIWGSFRGIYGIELTADGLDFKDGSVEAAAENKVLLAGFETSRPLEVNTYEAPYILQKDGYYYMFLSNGQCCSGSYSYNIRVGRSTSILGVYKDKEGRDLRGSDVGTYVVYAGAGFVATGHNSVVQDDAGDYWMLYHAYVGESRSARVMLLDKLLWDDENFPHTLGYTPSNNRKPGPALYLPDDYENN